PGVPATVAAAPPGCKAGGTVTTGSRPSAGSAAVAAGGWQSRQLVRWLARTTSWTTTRPFLSGSGPAGSGSLSSVTSAGTASRSLSATSASAACSAGGPQG